MITFNVDKNDRIQKQNIIVGLDDITINRSLPIENVELLPPLLNSSFEGDEIIEEMKLCRLCDETGFIFDTTEHSFKVVNNKKFYNYNKTPIKLFSSGRGPKEKKKPTFLQIEFTVNELLFCRGLDLASQMTMAGTGVLFMFPELFDQLMEIPLGEKKIKISKFVPENYLEKRKLDISQMPSDLDDRVYMKEQKYLGIEIKRKENIKYEILNNIDQIFVEKLEKLEKKNKINKEWAQKILIENGINPNECIGEFWLWFVKKLAYIKRVEFPRQNERMFSGIEMGLVQLGDGKHNIIELIFLEESNRFSNYTSCALEYAPTINEIKINYSEKCTKYTITQCLFDKLTKNARRMQEGQVFDKKDWGILICGQTKGERTLDARLEEDKLLDFSLKHQHAAVIELETVLDDMVKSHLGNKLEAYLPIALNAYRALEGKIKRENQEILLQNLIAKLKKKKKFEDPKTALLLKMLENKVSFQFISAYLQLIGFIDMILSDKKDSFFHTIKHNDSIHLQTLVNNKAHAILLPFDIVGSLQLLEKNPEILAQYPELISLFIPYNRIFSQESRLKQPKEWLQYCQKSLNNIIHSLEKEEKGKYPVGILKYLFSIYGFSQEDQLDKNFVNLPIQENFEEIFFSLRGFLSMKPHCLSQNEINNLSSILKTNLSPLERWKQWIIALSKLPSFQKIAWKSLHAFFDDNKIKKKQMRKFLDLLIESLKKNHHAKTLGRLSFSSEVEKLYEPYKRLKLILTAYSLDSSNVKIAEWMAKICQQQPVILAAKNLKKTTFIEKAAQTLINADKLDAVNDLMNILVGVDPEAWRRIFFSLMKHKSALPEKLFLLLQSSEEALTNTVFIDASHDLLCYLKDSNENDYNNWCSPIIQRVLSKPLSYEQKKTALPFAEKELKKNLYTTDKNPVNLVENSILEKSEKFKILIELLQIHAKKENKDTFCILFKDILTRFSNECYKSEVIKITVQENFLLLSPKQRLALLSYKEINCNHPFLLSLDYGLEIVLESINNENNFSQKKALLLACLGKGSPMNQHAWKHIDIILNILENETSIQSTRDFIDSQKIMVPKEIYQLLANHADDLFIPLTKPEQILSLLIYYDIHKIKIKFSKSTSMNILKNIETVHLNIGVDKIYQALEILRKNIIDKDEEIKLKCLYLYILLAERYLNYGKLQITDLIIDIILSIDPKSLSKEENNLFSRWATLMEKEKNFYLWDKWIDKIKHDPTWTTHLKQYCLSVHEEFGDAGCLEKLKPLVQSVNKKLREEWILVVVLKFTELTPVSTMLLWIDWLNELSVNDPEIWDIFLCLGLKSDNEIYFQTTVLEIEKKERLQTHVKSKMNDILFDDLIEKMYYEKNKDKFFLLADLFFNKMSMGDLLSVDHLTDLIPHACTLSMSNTFSQKNISILNFLEFTFYAKSPTNEQKNPVEISLIYFDCNQESFENKHRGLNRILTYIGRSLKKPFFMDEEIKIILDSLIKIFGITYSEKHILQAINLYQLLGLCKDEYTASVLQLLLSCMVINNDSHHTLKIIKYFMENEPKIHPESDMDVDHCRIILGTHIYNFTINTLSICKEEDIQFLTFLFDPCVDKFFLKEAKFNCMALYFCNTLVQIRNEILDTVREKSPQGLISISEVLKKEACLFIKNLPDIIDHANFLYTKEAFFGFFAALLHFSMASQKLEELVEILNEINKICSEKLIKERRGDYYLFVNALAGSFHSIFISFIETSPSNLIKYEKNDPLDLYLRGYFGIIMEYAKKMIEEGAPICVNMMEEMFQTQMVSNWNCLDKYKFIFDLGIKKGIFKGKAFFVKAVFFVMKYQYYADPNIGFPLNIFKENLPQIAETICEICDYLISQEAPLNVHSALNLYFNSIELLYNHGSERKNKFFDQVLNKCNDILRKSKHFDLSDFYLFITKTLVFNAKYIEFYRNDVKSFIMCPQEFNKLILRQTNLIEEINQIQRTFFALKTPVNHEKIRYCYNIFYFVKTHVDHIKCYHENIDDLLFLSDELVKLFVITGHWMISKKESFISLDNEINKKLQEKLQETNQQVFARMRDDFISMINYLVVTKPLNTKQIKKRALIAEKLIKLSLKLADQLGGEWLKKPLEILMYAASKAILSRDEKFNELLKLCQEIQKI